MKRAFYLCLTLIMVLGWTACGSKQENKIQEKVATTSSMVEVYYFHFTRRCVTCNAVESVSKKAIEKLYPEQLKSRMISFKIVNLDEDNSKDLADKLGVGGQCLIVVGGGKKIDLTSQGFMYARSNPEKLKAELKKAIDPLIK